MTAFAIDDSQWPVLVVTFGPNATEDDAHTFVRRARQYYARKEPFVSVLDGRQMAFSLGHAKIRKLLAEGHNALLVEFPGYKLGEGHVLSSATGRAAVTAGLLLRNKPFPVETFATLEDAIAWAKALLQKNTA